MNDCPQTCPAGSHVHPGSPSLCQSSRDPTSLCARATATLGRCDHCSRPGVAWRECMRSRQAPGILTLLVPGLRSMELDDTSTVHSQNIWWPTKCPCHWTTLPRTNFMTHHRPSVRWAHCLSSLASPALEWDGLPALYLTSTNRVLLLCAAGPGFRGQSCYLYQPGVLV